MRIPFLLGLLVPCCVLASPRSGTILVDQLFGGNAPTDINLSLSPSSSEGIVIDEQASNRGDYWIRLEGGNIAETGALISTLAEHARDNSSVGGPSGAILSTTAIVPVGPDAYSIGLFRLGNNDEFNANVSFGHFPFDEFLAGVASGSVDPVVLDTLVASQGIELGPGEQVQQLSDGDVLIDLRELGGDADKGVLLASNAENDDNVALVSPNDDGTFTISLRDNNTNATDALEPGAVSFAYVPFAEAGVAGSHVLAAARIASGSTAVKHGGSFYLTKGNTGIWYLNVPGYDASNATLLATHIWDKSGANSIDNFITTRWLEDENSWEIVSHDLPNGENQNGSSDAERMFSFVVLAKDAPSQDLGPELLESPLVSEIRPHSDSLIGNGIDTATGSFIQGRELLAVEGVRPLSFDINYNSRLTTASGPLGTSWSHNYEARLWGTLGTDIVIKWDAHRYSRFRYIEEKVNGLNYVGVDEDVRYASLAPQIPHPALPPGSWRLALEDGTTYYFGKDGRLTAEYNVVRQGIECYYDENGRLDELLEPYSGVRVFLGYNDDGLIETVSDDLGRMVNLSYDEQSRLLTVPAPFYPEEDEYETSFGVTAIPDDDGDGATIYVDVEEGGSIGGIVTTAFSVYHPRETDLAITITSPEGTVLEVPAVASTDDSRINYDGEFFEGFEGEDRRGRWYLTVKDEEAGVTGSIEAFSLSFSDSTRAVAYSYDEANRILSAEDSVGESLLGADYDQLGRIVRQSDGRVDTPDMTVEYLENQQEGTLETTYYDPLGEPWSFVHDEGFHLLQATDPLGNSTAFTYDENGARLSVVDAKGRTTSFTYSENGDVASMTDPAGYTTQFNYTGEHLVVEIIDALERETSMLYMNGRLQAVTDELGNQDKKEYHNNGQVSKVIAADNAFVDYKLDEQGRTGRISNPEYGDIEQNLNYDLAGRLIRRTDFGGNETQIFYNAAGEIRKQIDPEGNVSRWEYDNRGRLTKRIDQRGFATTFEYDGNGNMISSTNAIGETTTYTYDADDRLLTTVDARGATVTREYDKLGRVVAITDPLGRTTRTEYDEVGNVVRTIDANGETNLRIQYDERDLPVKMTDAMGHSVTTTYDAMMRRTQTVDELGRVTRYEYDELDRIVTVTGPSGRTSTAEYAKDDILVRLDPPGERPVSLGYDRSNNLTRVLLYNGSRTIFEYNARDLLSRKLTEGNHNINYTYDDVGRLSEADPTSSPLAIRGYEYDQAGNLLRVGTRLSNGGDLNPTITRTYDSVGRLATYTNERDETLVYAYDKSGNLSALIYPDGSEVSYSYDLASRLTSVEDWEGRVTNFTWDERDRLTKIEFPNGARRELNYDSAGNIRIRNDYDANGETILSYLYSYDAAGQLQSELTSPELEPAIPTPATYTYSNEGEIETLNGEGLGVGRDGELNRGPAGTHLESLAYNVWGQLYRTADYFHFYDEEDQLIGWEPRGAASVAEGNQLFVNPASGLSQILSNKGPDEASKRYVYGVGLLYEEDGNTGEIRVFHYDHRGSAVAFSGDDGLLLGRVGYTPYGEIAWRTGDTDTIFLFNALYGVVTTPEGLVHMRYRWYSPIVRRFLTRDAHLGNVTALSSMNRYAFAGGNPAMRIDPEGEFWWVAAGAAIGAAVNVGITFAVDISDGSIDESAATYLASAASGAVSGAIIAATGGLGGAVAGGIAGSLTEDLVYAGLSGESLDGREVATGAALGGLFGAAGHGAGKVAGKLGSKAYAKTFGKPGNFAKFVNKMTIPDKVARRRAVGSLQELVVRSGKREASDALKSFALGVGGRFLGQVGGTVVEQLSGKLFPSSGGGNGGSQGQGHYSVTVRANRGINANRHRAYGEYVHYDLFLDAVRLADRPVPNHPNNTLSGF
ncbi:DUF6531 domain-containing protein [Pelagicoccus sp. SDUM812003]|uniref:DUF6531 domain-containing protein n=1 Tax=Pelagicoccus sp. SDUM812003 TaxID=3041267 RepID=UPI00280C6EDE|nr:DUF6531 domain-containing protein [Pelagicoccus sp. SDUM812003]MDQ8205102.1 DUF6531 domain-containing protein [Pelagicoccus sp. SDUM812003]